MNDSLILVRLDTDYCNYLRQFDDKVPYNYMINIQMEHQTKTLKKDVVILNYQKKNVWNIINKIIDILVFVIPVIAAGQAAIKAKKI